MNNFFSSPAMLYLLAALLVLVFFLPDLLGPLPAIVIGGLVIGFALFVYNKWSQNADTGDDAPAIEDPEDNPEE